MCKWLVWRTKLKYNNVQAIVHNAHQLVLNCLILLQESIPENYNTEIYKPSFKNPNTKCQFSRGPAVSSNMIEFPEKFTLHCNIHNIFYYFEYKLYTFVRRYMESVSQIVFLPLLKPECHTIWQNSFVLVIKAVCSLNHDG